MSPQLRAQTLLERQKQRTPTTASKSAVTSCNENNHQNRLARRRAAEASVQITHSPDLEEDKKRKGAEENTIEIERRTQRGAPRNREKKTCEVIKNEFFVFCV